MIPYIRLPWLINSQLQLLSKLHFSHGYATIGLDNRLVVGDCFLACKNINVYTLQWTIALTTSQISQYSPTAHSC